MAVGMGVGLAVGVAVAPCGCRRGVAAAPETLISTHQDFAASAPMPNGTPLAFWNFQ